MSTKITRSSRANLLMVDSLALRLSQAIDGFQRRQTSWLIQGLAARGFDDLTPTHVAFISVLDCDDNVASEVARRLGLSRQAVHKTVRELCALGYIETVENRERRNSKVIQITERGERLIAQARQMFAQRDEDILDLLGAEDAGRLLQFLSEEPH